MASGCPVAAELALLRSWPSKLCSYIESKFGNFTPGSASVQLPNFEADLSFCFLERESGIEHSR
jgi:hypothetical protein